MTLGVGLLDYLTGFEVSFSVFYLLPTAFLAWRGGRGAGLFGAVAASAAWLFVELISGYPYSQPWIMYWNAIVRLIFFVITAQLIGRQKEVDRAHWPIGYSVGVVTFATPPADLEAATALADQMMYEAKSGGKDCWLHRAVDGGASS